MNAETHPEIRFESRRVEAAGVGRYRVIGDLTIRGVTREVTLSAEASPVLKDPWGNSRLAFSATGVMSRKEFGLTWNVALEAGGMLVSDEVRLEVEAEAVLQAAPVAEPAAV